MWLINAEAGKLECFNDERSLPPCAILSHTWTSSEVSMQEYIGSAMSKSMWRGLTQRSGDYNKIDRTCLQARADAIQYVWIDTCCIDKTSSAELSEAINSMFRWHQKAKICFVYLEDVTFGKDPAHSQTPFEPNCWNQPGTLVGTSVQNLIDEHV